jgi:hypothetical protein
MKKKKTLSQAPGTPPPRKQQWVETRNPSVHDPLEILDFPAQNPSSSFYQHSGFSPNMQTTLAITHTKHLNNHANASLQTIPLIHRFSTQLRTPDDEEEERISVSVLS